MFGDKVISVRVNRKNYKSSLTREQQKHISEIALDDFNFDFKIEAEDINNLNLAVEELIKKLI